MTNNIKSLFSREQITEVFKNEFKKNQNKTKVESQYGKKLRESKKITTFYGNISNKYLRKIIYKRCNSPAKINENLFSILESRLDVVLYRAAFFESIASAKQMIRGKGIKVNKNKVISPSFILTPGDIVSICNEKSCFKKLNQQVLLKSPSNHAKQSFVTTESGYKDSNQNLQNNNKDKNHNTKFKQKAKWNFKASPILLSLITEFKKNFLINTLNKILRLKENDHKRFLQLSSKNITDFNIVESFNENCIIGHKEANNFFCQQKKYKSASKLKTCFNSYSNNTNFNTKNLDFVKQNFTTDKNKKQELQRAALKLQNYKVDTLSFTHKNNFIFLNYLLYLKKNLEKSNKKKENKINSNIFGKAHNLEISYQSLSIVFLYPPQRICLPNFINPSLIYK